MGLLPDTDFIYLFATGGKRSRHALRQVRDARAVMHAGIAN